MAQTSTHKRTYEGGLITAVFVTLLLYNTLYWCAKFFGGALPSFFTVFYEAVKSNWWIFALLELLAVASLFVDVVVHFERFSKGSRTARLLLTAMLFFAFVLRMILGIIEMYMEGKVL